MISEPDFEEISLFDLSDEKDPPEAIKETTKTEIPAKEEIEPQEIALTAENLWQDKYWEFDITNPTQTIRDSIKATMIEEGFTKREVNHIFKGLFFKEKIFNTKSQAMEYLKTLPTTYAVKYKIGIPPSPKMLTLQKRCQVQEEKWTNFLQEQEKRWAGDFITCATCHSRINTHYITPPVCPVCKQDLRPQTVLKKWQSLQKALYDVQKKYEQTSRKYNAQFTGGEKWIIRTINSYKKS